MSKAGLVWISDIHCILLEWCNKLIGYSFSLIALSELLIPLRSKLAFNLSVLLSLTQNCCYDHLACLSPISSLFFLSFSRAESKIGFKNLEGENVAANQNLVTRLSRSRSRQKNDSRDQDNSRGNKNKIDERSIERHDRKWRHSGKRMPSPDYLSIERNYQLAMKQNDQNPFNTKRHSTSSRSDNFRKSNDVKERQSFDVEHRPYAKKLKLIKIQPNDIRRSVDFEMQKHHNGSRSSVDKDCRSANIDKNANRKTGSSRFQISSREHADKAKARARHDGHNRIRFGISTATNHDHWDLES